MAAESAERHQKVAVQRAVASVRTELKAEQAVATEEVAVRHAELLAAAEAAQLATELATVDGDEGDGDTGSVNDGRSTGAASALLQEQLEQAVDAKDAANSRLNALKLKARGIATRWVPFCFRSPAPDGVFALSNDDVLIPSETNVRVFIQVQRTGRHHHHTPHGIGFRAGGVAG